MDQEVDANPLWHTCLLLSRYDVLSQKMEVIEHWGFGGVPSTNSYACIRRLKKNWGVDTDFYGNHGMFTAEEMRRLERGYGLHGVTFELTAVKFNLLQNKCQQMLSDQNQAIQEAVQDLQLTADTSGKTRNYSFEKDSHRIYQHELNQAKTKKRSARLHEFSLSLFPQARTCKTHILSVLDGIISPQQLNRITGWHHAVTRFSGTMENIFLHSTGPLYQHQKSSGEKVHYRKSGDAKLYWTFPPQEIECLAETTAQALKLYPDQCDAVKKTIRQLQTLEWFFRNLILDPKYNTHRHALINHIINLYESFAKLHLPSTPLARNDWSNFWRWLTFQPRDSREKRLLENLEQAKHFMNSLYFAIVDRWEGEILPEADPNSMRKDAAQFMEIDLEVLASYLTTKQQKELCDILRRSYVTPIDRADTAHLGL